MPEIDVSQSGVDVGVIHQGWLCTLVPISLTIFSRLAPRRQRVLRALSNVHDPCQRHVLSLCSDISVYGCISGLAFRPRFVF